MPSEILSPPDQRENVPRPATRASSCRRGLGPSLSRRREGRSERGEGHSSLQSGSGERWLFGEPAHLLYDLPHLRVRHEAAVFCNIICTYVAKPITEGSRRFSEPGLYSSLVPMPRQLHTFRRQRLWDLGRRSNH
jgi:hypothetical protein